MSPPLLTAWVCVTARVTTPQVSAAKAISEPPSKKLKKVTLITMAHLIACRMAFFVAAVTPVSEKFPEYQWLLVSNRQNLPM